MDRAYDMVKRIKKVRSVVFALFLMSVTAVSLAAQAPTREQPSVWLSSLSIGVFGQPWEIHADMLTIGAHATRIEAGRLGGDFAVGTMPLPLAGGLLQLGARAGLALPLAYSENVLIVPSGGGSLVAAAGSHAFAAVGLNVGATTFLLNENRSGVRAGATWHWFGGSPWGGPFGIWLLEFGIVRRLGGL